MKYRLHTYSKHWCLHQLKALAEQINFWGGNIKKEQILKLKRAIVVKVSNKLNSKNVTRLTNNR